MGRQQLGKDRPKPLLYPREMWWLLFQSLTIQLRARGLPTGLTLPFSRPSLTLLYSLWIRGSGHAMCRQQLGKDRPKPLVIPTRRSPKCWDYPPEGVRGLTTEVASPFPFPLPSQRMYGLSLSKGTRPLFPLGRFGLTNDKNKYKARVLWLLFF